MEFLDGLATLGTGQTLLLLVALVIAFGFECVNGFHDTANAVATVIYTKSMKPTPAVVWSGLWNFIGVHAGGIGVAFSIVHLLPVDLLVNIKTGKGLAMVLSLLLAAILWNFATWYRGLPASSSHSLIGSIMGVGMMNAWIEHGSFVKGINWHKASEVAAALLVSPLLGFGLAAGLLLVLKATVRSPKLYEPPSGDEPPPWWIRAILVGTCTGVSFAHGSNDGKKTFKDLDAEQRWGVRTQLVELGASVRTLVRHFGDKLAEDRRKVLKGLAGDLARPVEYVPEWVKMGVALCLGLGTMVGWKRIVVTVGEKIGKTHLTYAQGASAELVAATTIGLADFGGLPVSTTHVLSSGVAGTMWANRSGVQAGTVREIALAWILTLPAVILMSGLIYRACTAFLG